MKKLFVFDLDDTLIDNVHDYAGPLLDACRFIIQMLGSKAPHVSKIIAMEQETDTRRVKEINPETQKPYLFSMERFPGSLVEVYRQICKQANVWPAPEAEEVLFDIGLQAFDEQLYAENTKPYTLRLLDFLRHQEDILILCSKGDSRVQTKKLSALKNVGVNHFSRTRIVEEKTPEIFQEFASEFTDYSLYSVGNSYKSDLVPALEVGFRGILIPVETWELLDKMDEMLKDVDKTRCHIFESLKEIKTRYEELS